MSEQRTAAAAIGAALGITAADLTAIGNDNTDLHNKINASAVADAAAQQSTDLKNTSVGTAERTARLLARRLKINPAYTDALGEQLGIVGPEDTTDLAAAKPTLTVRALPHGVVELVFNKSKSDGVNIYSRRTGDAGFVFLARDTASAVY